jgi:hypothetical protein
MRASASGMIDRELARTRFVSDGRSGVGATGPWGKDEVLKDRIKRNKNASWGYFFTGHASGSIFRIFTQID